MNIHEKGQQTKELAQQNNTFQNANINTEGKLQFDREIERLAKLSTLEYESERKSTAKQFNVRLNMIDNAVEVHRQQGCDDASQSLPEYARKMEPWHEEVSGDELADIIYQKLKRYLGAPDAIIRVLTIWIISTYCYQSFSTFPYLYFSSPEPGCGKTTALKLLRAFSCRAVLTSNLTSAVVYRLVDKYSPTLLIDEIDTYLEMNESLQGILNSGHEKLGYAYRCNEAKNNDVESYHTYCPKALAGIGEHRKPALASRCITIKLKKLLASEEVEEMPDHIFEESENIRRQCIRWSIDTPLDMGVDMPYKNRTKDNWKALFCISAAVSAEWHTHIKSAILIAIASTNDIDAHVGTRLLHDIRAVFNNHSDNKNFMRSVELCKLLKAVDEHEWADHGYGKGIKPRELAKLLKPYGIKSRQKKLNSKKNTNYHGYCYNDFKEAFTRYLTKPPEKPATAATSATSANIAPSKPNCLLPSDATNRYPDETRTNSGNNVV
ncbi:MAG: DUF3631 domain-containing protein [Gammaproteobacteria bacterium]|nr:DUF3631 domain-containing protein [Gammaproteobacteria bacterium]